MIRTYYSKIATKLKWPFMQFIHHNRSQDDRVLRLASPIISASFQCENCTLLNLSTPVEITFEHCSYDQVKYTQIESGDLCIILCINTHGR